MIAKIKRFFGIAPAVPFGELIATGAKIIDVRSPAEFAGGHLKNSVNTPLPALGGQLNKLKKDQAIITCCASGMRSRSAKALLQSNGFNNVYNGGSWNSLRKFER